jgi:hypothetical protein
MGHPRLRGRRSDRGIVAHRANHHRHASRDRWVTATWLQAIKSTSTDDRLGSKCGSQRAQAVRFCPDIRPHSGHAKSAATGQQTEVVFDLIESDGMLTDPDKFSFAEPIKPTKSFDFIATSLKPNSGAFTLRCLRDRYRRPCHGVSITLVFEA